MANGLEQLEIVKVKENAFTNRFLLYFSAFIMFVAVTFFFAITFIPIPKDNIRFADTILGFIGGTLISSVINYYWGSSKQQSKDKEAIDTLLKQATAPTTDETVSDLVHGGNNVTVAPADGTKTVVTDDSTTITADNSESKPNEIIG